MRLSLIALFASLALVGCNKPSGSHPAHHAVSTVQHWRIWMYHHCTPPDGQVMIFRCERATEKYGPIPVTLSQLKQESPGN